MTLLKVYFLCTIIGMALTLIITLIIAYVGGGQTLIDVNAYGEGIYEVILCPLHLLGGIWAIISLIGEQDRLKRGNK